jgi:hypothetical protein
MSNARADYKAVKAERRVTVRKGRLVMVACCRQMSHFFFDPWLEQTLAVAERCADNPAGEADVERLGTIWVTNDHPRLPEEEGLAGDIARAITQIAKLAEETPNDSTLGDQYSNPKAAIVGAVLLSLRELPLVVFSGGHGDAVETCIKRIERARVLLQVQGGRDLADFLRDMFLSFRVDAAWRAPAVHSAALAAYEHRIMPQGTLDPKRVALVADELERAGCRDDDVLGHLRRPGVHVRGCHVVDALLGKE